MVLCTIGLLLQLESLCFSVSMYIVVRVLCLYTALASLMCILDLDLEYTRASSARRVTPTTLKCKVNTEHLRCCALYCGVLDCCGGSWLHESGLIPPVLLTVAREERYMAMLLSLASPEWIE